MMSLGLAITTGKLEHRKDTACTAKYTQRCRAATMCISSADIKVPRFIKRAEKEKQVLVEVLCIGLISNSHRNDDLVKTLPHLAEMKFLHVWEFGLLRLLS